MSVDEVQAPADATCQRYLDALRAEFGDKVLAAELTKNDLVIRVDRSVWAGVATSCKRIGLRQFGFLSGLDWLDSPAQTTRYENVWGSVEEEAPAADEAAATSETAPTEPAPAEPAVAATNAPAPARRTGTAGGESRFQVFARFASVTDHRAVVVKADLDDTDPRVPTISKVYAGADWHERETWEMFGFWFEGHPNLVHIYLPGSFEGYPLRKDFPLLAREVKPWPGLTNVEPIAGEAETEEAEA